MEDTFWKDLLGSTATFTTICQFLSGMFTAHKIVVRQKGNVGDLSPVPFLMGSMGCALWLIYGLLRNDRTVVNCNIVGTLLNAFYVLVFVRYTVMKTLIFRQVTAALLILSVILLYVHNELVKMNTNVKIGMDSPVMQNVGLVCIVISLLGCASPLVALKEVIRTRSTEILPFPLIFSMFLVCAQWWVYGILAEDPYMQFTNLLGTCIALVQLGLFCFYPSTQVKNNGHGVGGPEYKKLHNVI